MTAEITTVIGQLSISGGSWRNNAPNQVAVREPQSAEAPGAGKGDLFIATEIQGNVTDRDVAEQQLAQTIRDSYYLSRGSITASLRRAVQAGSDLLYHRNRQLSVEERVAGGAVVLVISGEDTFLAQIGPAAFFAVLGDHIQRYPVRSTWLDEAMGPTQDEAASAMGLSTVVEPNLQHLRVSPQDTLVLADSRLASQLPLKDVVQAVVSDNVKTAVKNLGKTAKAHTCSALVLKVVEATPATIGPLKIGAPSQLSGILTRHRSQPTNGETSTPRPPAPEAVAEAIPQPIRKPDLEASPPSTATFASVSIAQKPLQWLGAFTGKSQPEAADDESILSGEKEYFQPQAHDDLRPEAAEQSQVMASIAPEVAYRPDFQTDKSADSFSLVQKIFSSLGLGLLMLVALLGSGLKSIFSLILPSTNHHTPRQAGLQAQQHSSSSSWGMLRNVAIAIPLLVALIVTVNYLQKGRIREAEYNEFVTTAQNKFEQAQAVDVTAALGLMAEAEAALVQAEQIKQDQPEITELRQQMAEAADKMGNVHRLYYLPQLRQYTDTGTDLKSIAVQGVEIYVMDAGNDRVFHHRLDDLGEALLPDDESVVMVTRGQPVDDITVGDLLGMTWMPTGGNRQTSDLVLLNSTGLLEYNPNWGITTSALAGGDLLGLPVAVDSFFGNFYILDPQVNALFRYRATADGYSAPPESYFPVDQPVDLTNAIDLAIDGAIYVLFKDGRINKYLSGEPLDFIVSGLDRPLSNPVSIFTAPNEEVQYVYVADAGNQRIVQLNKDGSFVRQFKPRAGEAVSFSNLQDIFVDEIGGRLYVLDSNNLYVGNIPNE